MYIAKINRKDNVNGAVRLFVDFTDGVNTYTDACIPQDKESFLGWVKSQLSLYNNGNLIGNDFTEGQEVVIPNTNVLSPILTPEQLVANTWVDKYNKWIKVKQNLIDTGILTGTEPQVVALKTSVKNDFISAYLDLI